MVLNRGGATEHLGSVKNSRFNQFLNLTYKQMCASILLYNEGELPWIKKVESHWHIDKQCFKKSTVQDSRKKFFFYYGHILSFVLLIPGVLLANFEADFAKSKHRNMGSLHSLWTLQSWKYKSFSFSEDNILLKPSSQIIHRWKISGHKTCLIYFCVCRF